MDQARIVRELRLLKAWAAVSGALLAVLLAGAFRSERNQGFAVIDVERINVVEPDGRLALVLANGARMPGPILEGRELPPAMSSGRTGSAGLLFFNERGDEVGGLTFRGRETPDGYGAGAILAFDQFRQDQVVAMQYADRGTSRSAGLSVWDRSTTVTIHELVRLLEASRGPAGAAQEDAARRLQELQQEGTLGAQRVYLGSQDRTAALRISDTRGRTRIRLLVDSADVPRLEVLDANGAVVHSWPPAGR